MANLVNVTPIMTTNTTPSPYVTSADSLYSGQVWYPYDSDDTTTWSPSASGYTHYSMLDFGSKTAVSNVIVNVTTAPRNSYIKTIDVNGSDDGSTWDAIVSYETATSGSSTQFQIDFGEVKNYSKYKVIFTMSIVDYPVVSEIKYYLDKDIIPEPQLKVFKTLKANLPTYVNAMFGTELHFTEDGGIYINKADGTLRQIGVSDGILARLTTLETSTTHSHTNKDVLDKLTYDSTNGLMYDGVAIITDINSYADQKVLDLVNSAPDTMNTLNELATALGNDPDFANTINTKLETKGSNDDVTTMSTKITNDINAMKTEISMQSAYPKLTNEEW